MRILWISSLAWKNANEYLYPVNGAGAVSGSLFQQSMIEGLERLGHTVDIVSDYPYAAGRNIHSQVQWSHSAAASDVFVKTIDVPYLSLIYKEHSLKKEVKKKLKETKYDFVVAYLIHQPYMSAIAYAKGLDPDIKTVLICPDLPDMMDMSLANKKIKAFLKKIDQKRINKLYKKMDGYVLFAEPMQERIDMGSAKYTVIEGVATIGDLDITPVDKERFVMYAGTLHRNIGIENIIDSLEYINDKSLKLKIYGTGELEEYVKSKAQQDHRIIYGGFINREALFEEQKKALALINARNPKDAFTRYSFPSKTFEYLYSGTPFITTALEGVPKEYEEFLFVIEDNDPRTIAREIDGICLKEKEEILERGCNARRFITQKKTAAFQTEKLVRFLEALL